MSDMQPPPANPSPGASARTRTVMRTVLYCCLAATLGFLGFAAVRATQEQAGVKRGQERLVAMHGLIQPAHKRLAPEYADQDGQLVADPPTDPEKLLDPEVLVLAHRVGDDDDTQLVAWEELQAHLAAATGKQVEVQEYINSAEDIADLKAGKIHVVVLHAADTPYVVNNAGFVPIGVLGGQQGASGNHLDIAVRSNSPIKSLADLRGRKLTCTRPDSITGYRAAIAVLAQEAGLRPDVDYRVHFSHGQKRSVLGLVGGAFEVAALSDDKVQSLIDDGSIKETDLRFIYESQVVPRLTIGHVYNLQPELAETIAAAALAFKNEGGPVEPPATEPMRFVAIDYKKDFEFVRKMDDSFDPRFGESRTASLTH